MHVNGGQGCDVFSVALLLILIQFLDKRVSMYEMMEYAKAPACVHRYMQAC